MFDFSQASVPEVRRKPTTGVTGVGRVREVGGVESGGATAPVAEARLPAMFGPVYGFAQNMGLIQNRTLLIMQSRHIRDITRQTDLFDKEDVRKKFSNALVMVAAHSPEELEIFLLTTQRMAQSGHSERLAAFFDQVTEALTDRVKKKDDDDEDVMGDEEAFPIPQHPDEDLVAQIRETLEKQFARARSRATALGIVPGEQPSAGMQKILKAGKEIVEAADPAPETVLDLLTVAD